MKKQTKTKNPVNQFVKLSLVLMVLIVSNIGIKTQGVGAKKANSFETLIQSSFNQEVQAQQSFTYKKVDGREIKSLRIYA